MPGVRGYNALNNPPFPDKEPSVKRWINMLAWASFALAVLFLVAWPLMIWSHVKNGLPWPPAMLETLPYPLGALIFWIIARGLKLFTDLPSRG
jgi:hypothetical protein